MDRLDLENIEYCNDLAKRINILANRINMLADDIDLGFKEIDSIKSKLKD